MVGGRVLESRRLSRNGRDVLRIWCMDGMDELAIYVEYFENGPKPGDRVWWQGPKAYWTNFKKTVKEFPMTRVGYSFDPRKTDA